MSRILMMMILIFLTGCTLQKEWAGVLVMQPAGADTIRAKSTWPQPAPMYAPAKTLHPGYLAEYSSGFPEGGYKIRCDAKLCDANVLGYARLWSDKSLEVVSNNEIKAVWIVESGKAKIIEGKHYRQGEIYSMEADNVDAMTAQRIFIETDHGYIVMVEAK